ncbi:uncharacterized protein LOC135076585 [Ostrinia nubilalis]|uniref:uncharacterized protein LOC135076585 n=1 Tax=Ostrinia nubilalis TaxID=29057 RepID=UPI0030825E7B
MPPSDAHRLPASLLSWHAARDYCSAHIDNLHGAKPVRVESLSLALPALECGARVVAVASAAGGRRQDLDLARLVLEFLFQTGVRRNTASCKGACRQAARDALPSLLQAHPHLYEVALRHVADTSQVEKLEPSSISCLAVDRWRPQPHEAYDVAFDWSQRCPHLLPALLLNLDYTPHTGISLDAQLGLGGWLCSHVRSLAPAEPDDWCWRALRALRLHRACWGLRPEAPSPDPEPDDLFSKAYALMQSSWGHCIPLVRLVKEA